MEYVSYACSKYYPWFKELGYDRLDVAQYADGSFSIIQFYTLPVVPSLTSWNVVLGPINNVEISKGFIKKYVEAIDNTKREFWAREKEKTDKVFRERAAQDRWREDVAERAFQAVRRNHELVNRVAKNGLAEMNLDRIIKHIPRQKLIGLNK